MLKGTFHFKYVLKNKQNKLRQSKKNEIKEGIYSNYTNIIKYTFYILPFLLFIR